MRKYLISIVIILIVGFLQESFLLELFGKFLNPNLLLIIAFSLYLGGEDDLALFCALIGGLVLDLLGIGVVGVSSLIFVLLMLVSMGIRRTVFRGIITQLFFVLLTSVLYKVVINYPPFIFNNLLFVSGIVNTFLSLLLSQLIKKFRKRYLSSEFRIRA